MTIHSKNKRPLAVNDTLYLLNRSSSRVENKKSSKVKSRLKKKKGSAKRQPSYETDTDCESTVFSPEKEEIAWQHSQELYHQATGLVTPNTLYNNSPQATSTFHSLDEDIPDILPISNIEPVKLIKRKLSSHSSNDFDGEYYDSTDEYTESTPIFSLSSDYIAKKKSKKNIHVPDKTQHVNTRRSKRIAKGNKIKLFAVKKLINIFIGSKNQAEIADSRAFIRIPPETLARFKHSNNRYDKNQARQAYFQAEDPFINETERLNSLYIQETTPLCVYPANNEYRSSEEPELPLVIPLTDDEEVFDNQEVFDSEEVSDDESDQDQDSEFIPTFYDNFFEVGREKVQNETTSDEKFSDHESLNEEDSSVELRYPKQQLVRNKRGRPKHQLTRDDSLFEQVDEFGHTEDKDENNKLDEEEFTDNEEETVNMEKIISDREYKHVNNQDDVNNNNKHTRKNYKILKNNNSISIENIQDDLDVQHIPPTCVDESDFSNYNTIELLNEIDSPVDSKELSVSSTLLGEGQVGIVRLGEYNKFKVACKSKRYIRGNEKKFNKSIYNEFKFADMFSRCRFTNPYIGWVYCDVKDVERNYKGKINKRLYVIQRYVDNGDARKYFCKRKEPIQPYEALQASICLFTALSDIHKLNIGIVDLKLENFLIDLGGSGWLTDFGSCVEIEDAEEISLDDRGLDWTYEVAAPEMISSNTYSKLSDIFMACVLVAELLTTNLEDDAFEDKVLKRNEEGSTNFSSKSIDKKFKMFFSILKKGLSNSPKHRPTAATMLNELLLLKKNCKL